MKINELNSLISEIYENAAETEEAHEKANDQVGMLIKLNCYQLLATAEMVITKTDNGSIKIEWVFKLDGRQACPYGKDGKCTGCKNFAFYEDRSGNPYPTDNCSYNVYCIKDGE